MNTDTGRFEIHTPQTFAKLPAERRERIMLMPTLEVGEAVTLNDLPLVVESIKPSGKLKLRFSTPMRVGFDKDDRVTIKGVQFRVTFWAGELLGLRMIKKAVQ